MFRTRSRARWLGAACMSALVFATGCGGEQGGEEPSSPAKARPITIASTSFSDARASTALATEVLKRAGYRVNIQMLGSIGLDFAAVANRRADVFPDAWLPHTHGQYWERYGSKLEKISKLYTQPVSSGLAVPNYCPTQSVDQLNAQASSYDNKIIGIEAGSGLMITTKKLVQDYGLRLTLVPGSESAMLATLKKAVSQRKCAVVTLWRPHAAFALYPIRYLKEPKGIYKPDEAWTVAPPDFKEDFPNAYAFLKKFTIPLSDQEEIIARMVNERQTPEQAVRAWMTEHPDTVKTWANLARGPGGA